MSFYPVTLAANWQFNRPNTEADLLMGETFNIQVKQAASCLRLRQIEWRRRRPLLYSQSLPVASVPPA